MDLQSRIEKIVNDNCKEIPWEGTEVDTYGMRNEIYVFVIEFAKIHVQEALKCALEEVPYGGSDATEYEDVVGILTCYPLENIK